MKIDKITADRLFDGITCPHCNEDYKFDGPYGLEVLKINSINPNSKPECIEYNLAIDKQFQELRNDRISKEEFVTFARGISNYNPVE